MFTTVAIMIQELVLGDGWGRGGAPPPPWALGLFHHFNFLFFGQILGDTQKMKIVDFR